MMQQGQLLESQRGQKQTSIFTHRVFYHEIVFDSASADLPAFFVVADTGEIEVCDGKLKLYLRISVKKTKKKSRNTIWKARVSFIVHSTVADNLITILRFSVAKINYVLASRRCRNNKES